MDKGQLRFRHLRIKRDPPLLARNKAASKTFTKNPLLCPKVEILNTTGLSFPFTSSSQEMGTHMAWFHFYTLDNGWIYQLHSALYIQVPPLNPNMDNPKSPENSNSNSYGSHTPIFHVLICLLTCNLRFPPLLVTSTNTANPYPNTPQYTKVWHTLGKYIYSWAALPNFAKALYKWLAVASCQRLLTHNSLPTGYLRPCQLDTWNYFFELSGRHLGKRQEMRQNPHGAWLPFYIVDTRLWLDLPVTLWFVFDRVTWAECSEGYTRELMWPNAWPNIASNSLLNLGPVIQYKKKLQE